MFRNLSHFCSLQQKRKLFEVVPKKLIIIEQKERQEKFLVWKQQI